MSAKAVGKKIQQARKEFGLTQSDLAYRVGVSTQSISAFESGRIPPATKYLMKIAQFTHKPLHYFTGEKVAMALERVENALAELTEIKRILSEITEPE